MKQHPLRRLWLLLALIPLIVCSGLLVPTTTAKAADTGGYPFAAYSGPGSNPAQSIWTDPSGGQFSKYLYNYRNCTDYVAWKLDTSNGWNAHVSMGNAIFWKSWASNSNHKYTVDNTPATGSVAWWNGHNGYGHVAYVLSTDGTNVTLGEYNFNWPKLPGTYSTRTIPASKVDNFIHFKDVSSSPTNLAKNGNFDWGGNDWTRGTGNNFAVYASGARGTTSYEGSHYAATDGGGSLYQDIAVSLSQGQTICASLMLSTVGGSGSSGNIDVWVNGNYSAIHYAHVPGNSVWVPYKVCNTALSSASGIRFQIYPDASSPTVALDAIDIHYDLAENGDFTWGGNGWIRGTGNNFAVYSSGARGTTSYEGSHYAATDGGGSLYQDIAVNLSQGQTVCASLMLSTVGGSGSSGNIDVWINGLYSTIRYTHVPGNSAWVPYKVCNTALSSVSGIRLQIYPDASSPTVALDAIDVHGNLAINGNFDWGGNDWTRGIGNNFAVYASGARGTTSYSGSHYAATDGGGSLYQDIAVSLNTGDTVCASLMLTTVGSGSGSSGSIDVWINGAYSAIRYNNVPGNSVWTPYKVCLTATSAASSTRFQIYPDAGNPTVGVDTVDID